MARSTLGTRVARRDERRFVGRRAELALFAELFVDDPPASVVLVHGPGGIGKSALLRGVARRGERDGWSARLVDGRDLPPVPEALEDALAGVRDEQRPLLLFDTFERLTALGVGARDRTVQGRITEHDRNSAIAKLSDGTTLALGSADGTSGIASGVAVKANGTLLAGRVLVAEKLTPSGLNFTAKLALHIRAEDRPGSGLHALVHRPPVLRPPRLPR